MTEATPRSQRILADKLRGMIAGSPQGVAAPALMGAIAAVLMWNSTARVPLLLSLAFLYGVLGWWVMFYVEYRRTELASHDAELWARRVWRRTLAHGLAWGIYSLVLFPSNPAYQSLLVAFMYGLVAGGVVVDGPHFPTFVVFALPTLGPVILRCFAEGTASSVASGVAGLVGLAQSLYASVSSSRVADAAIVARFENLALLAEVGKQKELAEQARSHAEAANQEKSRFLAAASHDLRQPMHALRLFASAAKGATSEAERGQIVEHIDACVASLSALFDALLEVSQLDAGAVAPRLTHVHLGPLLAELVTEHEAAAQQRGLSLRLRCLRLQVHTDPVLLGRLLRNLLSNALTHSERGGVLVACRKRDGRARLEVWDTGVGIPAQLQAQVFEEFFQVNNPERDHRKGVGLGLAIVARIATLLGYRVEVASRVGRGTRFSLEIPLAEAPTAATAAAVLVDDTALFGAKVVVIDDEPEILAGTVLLLKQYGCQPIAAQSLAAAQELLAAADITPDLLISDYRLADGHTAADVARALRARHGLELPVLVVSGDSGANVSEPRVTLLRKPLGSEQLKQAMLQLL